MPRMIKITYQSPEGVLAMQSGLCPTTEIKESFKYIESKIYYYGSRAGEAEYLSETVSVNPSQCYRYYHFFDYPSKTPRDLKLWFWNARRALDSTHCWDTVKQIKLPGEPERTIRYNLFQKWNNTNRIRLGIKSIKFEEVEHTFPEIR
jgi:hypothetical protein